MSGEQDLVNDLFQLSDGSLPYVAFARGPFSCFSHSRILAETRQPKAIKEDQNYAAYVLACCCMAKELPLTKRNESCVDRIIGYIENHYTCAATEEEKANFFWFCCR